MKVGRDYSWWVEYSWTYRWYNVEEKCWEEYDDFGSGRFTCTKKNLKKEVTDYIEKYELADTQYCDLKVSIDDAYMTTTEEV